MTLVLTERQLQGIMKKATITKVAQWTPHLRDAMQEFGINTIQRAAGFLASVANETGQLSEVVEASYINTPYTRVQKVFASSAPPENLFEQWKTLGQARFDENFFNWVYDDRKVNKGLGNLRDGDGYKYRGRGPGQLTGRNNYRAEGKKLGIDLENNPDALLDPGIGARAFAQYWAGIGNNQRLDNGDVEGAMRIMNPGLYSFANHLALYRVAIDILSKDVKETPETPREAAKQVVSGPTGIAGAGGAVLATTQVIDGLSKINTQVTETTATVEATKGLFSAFGLSPATVQVAVGGLVLVLIVTMLVLYGRRLFQGKAYEG